MKVCGLTGGIGMGKSTADKLLLSRGVPVADTDLLAHQLVEPGQPALAEIQNTFGKGVIAPDGTLRRDALAAIVFADGSQRVKLENILHPRIRAAWLKQISEWKAEGKPVAVVDIPLLFETGAEKHFDAIICVACSTATQQRRLVARGWKPEHIKQRNASQMSVEEKIGRSTFVVWTEGTPEVDGQQLDRILRQIN
ncbi:MAG TPA: dephospho-CoA kinase [Verrucomicrobiae bacterium]|jgi:dephospho-CoA kinase|nr:dephospho-CoA kinase [Verrucomicrobiae bacterium]